MIVLGSKGRRLTKIFNVLGLYLNFKDRLTYCKHASQTQYPELYTSFICHLTHLIDGVTALAQHVCLSTCSNYTQILQLHVNKSN